MRSDSRRAELAAVAVCPRGQDAYGRLRARARRPAPSRGDTWGSTARRPREQRRPRGCWDRSIPEVFYGASRDNAISLRGTNLERFWFDLRTQRPKVPNSQELSLPARDVSSNGNAVETDACTGSCKNAACGDGVIQAGVEMCDDMNGLDDDGCVACVIPKSCKEIKAKSPGATDGVYKIDLDGEGGMMPVPVECDMTIDGGGWTVVEKSPLAAPIGTALFVDKPINEGDPMMMQYRAPKAIMIALQAGATLMRIDCNGPDYLLTDDMSLFAGEMLPNSCMQVIGVTFKEASLAGAMVTNKAICVQLRGVGDNPACPAAFGISEVDQMPCGLMSPPFGVPKLGQGAFAFAPDSPVKDPKHDCHKPGASRFVMLR